MSANKGLRLIALVEALKGMFALLIGVVALLLPQRDLQQFVIRIVDAFRLDPAAHYTSRFIQEASLVTPQDLGWVAVGALAYSLFRFGEAYGLWRESTWAEWLAVVSGAIYIPFEVFTIYRRPTLFKFVILAVNILVVVYVAMALARKGKRTLRVQKTGPGPA